MLYTSCAAGSMKSSGPVPMNSGEDMSYEHPVVPGMYILGPAAPQQLGLQPTYFCTRPFAAAEALASSNMLSRHWCNRQLSQNPEQLCSTHMLLYPDANICRRACIPLRTVPTLMWIRDAHGKLVQGAARPEHSMCNAYEHLTANMLQRLVVDFCHSAVPICCRVS